MTDFDKASKLLLAVEEDVRKFLMNPADYQSMFFEDVHIALIEAMETLGIVIESNEEEADIALLEEAQYQQHARELENYDQFNQITTIGE